MAHTSSYDNSKPTAVHLEMGPEQGFEDKADLSGQAATDEHGHSLLHFDPAAERRLVRKIDLYIVPTVAMLYLFCFIDRANIGNARLAGFEKDLHLTGLDYNKVLSVFYISYIIFEIPSTVACKILGPGWFLPGTALGFGILTVAFAFVRDIQTACAVRFLLGMFEAGMLPGIAYYMSRWYRRSELAFRLALYVMMAPLGGAFGGLLASAILRLDSFGSVHTWKMIFAIEGIVTIGLALLSFVTLTDRPETARWLSHEEKLLAINRLKSERVGTTEVLDRMDTKKVLRGILNPVVLATSWVFLLACITVQGLSFFAPTIIRTIYPNATVVHQQLLTVPPFVLGATAILVVNFTSWKTDKRNIYMGVSALPVIVGYIMFLASTNAKVRYAAVFIIATGAFNSGALCNAQVAANVVSDTARSSAIGTNVMFGNIGGIISTWAFLPGDKPNYPIGNGLNLAAQSLILITCVGMALWMTMDNKRRQRKDVAAELSGLSHEKIVDLDWRHPGFEWRP
ncbi:MFS general substrate transporter [Cucurbitaria berberidis CBS 394.84]|uniref:MFS general substrate transporter n=1 Tax=Cucurbitaria berberidis CBS 394.84 TaxID=1168544 RepID=A0A9P4L3Q8_9PLEO|nr:MFS general substrate transporter [Cucurbitaria berberidis CBS 394.84]KAF1841206.1 MFS general substrate transporter [Cucurbitaria berberidis CBS 394.84]